MIAKYDGRCPGCEGDIFEGVTEIVKDDGEWVCVDCVDPGPMNIIPTRRAKPADTATGDDAFALLAGTSDEPAAKPSKRASKKATPHTDIRGDRYGRYTLIAPDGKPVVVSRASTVIKALADTYNLNQWKQACVLRGAARRPDLTMLAASLDPDDYRGKARMRELVQEAEEAGGSKTSANLGTALHSFCESIDTDPDFLLTDIPRAYRRDVVAYIGTLYKAGIAILPDMVERTTMTTNWDGVGGTFDRIYRLADGRHVIGDLKTGKVGYDPPEMEAQFAVYQDGVQQNGVYDRRGEDGRYPGTWTRPDFDVDRDEALIVHLPAGKGECTLYTADLTRGRLHLDRCARIRAERREKHTLRPYVAPPRVDHPADHMEKWAHALEFSTSVDTAVMVGQIIAACGLMTDDLKELGKEVVAKFSDGEVDGPVTTG